jgi:outer membrane protein OmpA-like peptidoglycan-associated protein
MENVTLPGTVGRVQEVNATYELLPRKQFTYDTASQDANSNRRVSQEEYEAILALYQAQNALQIAEAQNAQRYAPERLARARELLQKAKGYPKSLHKEIVSLSREATQVAEDARMIAVKRAEAERAAEQEQQRQEETQNRAETPQATVKPERERSRIAPVREPQSTPRAPETSPKPTPRAEAPIVVDPAQFRRQPADAKKIRARILTELSGMSEIQDTARGITLTVPDTMLGTTGMAVLTRRVATVIAPYKELHVEVNAHTDRADHAGVSQRQAELVSNALVAAGVSPNVVIPRNYGNSRPRTSNATVDGRAQNRRVEIVIAGGTIGTIPTWDQTYTLLPSRRR